MKDKELKIICCPTKEMVADFFTKPLQGVLFNEHRNSVLGINTNGMVLYRKQYHNHIINRNNLNIQ